MTNLDKTADNDLALSPGLARSGCAKQWAVRKHVNTILLYVNMVDDTFFSA